MRLGDYVHASQVNGDGSRQGVFAEEYPDGTIRVEGELGEYHCHGEGAVVIPNENLILSSTREFVCTRQQQLRPFEEEE